MNITLSKKPVVSGNIILIMIFVCIGALFFNNGIYLFCCMATLFAMFGLLWRKNRPGILLFAFFMQWTQVITFVIWMNYYDYPIDRLSAHGGIAVVMSCLGFLVMAAVVARGINGLPIPSREDLYNAASHFNEKKVFTLYLGSSLFLTSIGFVLGLNSGFAQILVSLSGVRWIFFLLYGFVAWINRKNRLIFFAMVLFEFSTSLYSYFSSFKEVILITIILALTFIRKISFKQFLYSLVISFCLAALMFTWTAIKGDYRNYLNSGNRKQVINVSREEAFGKIGEQISQLDWERYQYAIAMSLYRLQYVYHLALTMDRVPAILPYENGQLWWSNISYVLVPRLFYPNKPLFEATVKTNKYTGLNYLGLKEGSSFSLGYFADGYIDFGYAGMFLPLFFFGLFIAFFYNVFYKIVRLNILLRYALINVSFYNFIYFESDAVFIFGRMLTTILVFWVLAKIAFPRLQVWLYK